jgi:hypothetical protein
MPATKLVSTYPTVSPTTSDFVMGIQGGALKLFPVPSALSQFFAAAGKTFTASNTLTLAGTDGTTITFQGTDTYVGRATTDSLYNKTLVTATFSGVHSGGGATIAFSTPIVEVAAVSNPYFQLHESGGGTDLKYVRCGLSGGTLSIEKVNDAYSSATTLFQILTNATLVPRGLIDISAAAAGQIKFPAASNPSADANTLDDYQEATYTATATGMTTSPTATFSYTIEGNMVTLNIEVITGTSNATTFTVTGAPTEIRPANTKRGIVRAQNSGTFQYSHVEMSNAGVLTVFNGPTEAAWTASGTKSIQKCTICYTLV